MLRFPVRTEAQEVRTRRCTRQEKAGCRAPDRVSIDSGRRCEEKGEDGYLEGGRYKDEERFLAALGRRRYEKMRAEKKADPSASGRKISGPSVGMTKKEGDDRQWGGERS